ncbi:sigma factor-like helix-turn-helix DNA-binding protein [Eisenbergiella porci]|uniref:sigma factor-like helix-turn-helix DNA-binding protein n=1 Tax=Eisenbergiella porci TaxID=2652274 RepID=UPI002A7F16DE|nr:sigma factor-like helix-turn-helix DNA-binding protein [Eisenbergiella porci]
MERVENIGLYDFLLEDLSEREKQVVDLVIIGETLQTDVGRRLGVSQSYVSRIERRAIQKMKQKMTPQLCKAARSDRNNQTLIV